MSVRSAENFSLARRCQFWIGSLFAGQRTISPRRCKGLLTAARHWCSSCSQLMLGSSFGGSWVGSDHSSPFPYISNNSYLRGKLGADDLGVCACLEWLPLTFLPHPTLQFQHIVCNDLVGLSYCARCLYAVKHVFLCCHGERSSFCL